MQNIQKTSRTIHRNLMIVARLGLGVLALAFALTAGLAAPASAGTKLQGTKLQGTKLQGTKLQGTKLQGTKLQGTRLQGTKLRASRRPMYLELVRSVQTCHAGHSSAYGAVSRQVCSISIATGK